MSDEILSMTPEEAYEAGYTVGSKRDWTPCADGLPTNSARYKVTLQVGSEAGTWLETAIIPYRYCDGTGEWILQKSDWMIYGVIAWTKADEPYRADDTTGKVKEEKENG